MQLANIVLRLGGSVLHTVPKDKVTPAEILVLQRIHGSDAVVDVRPAGEDKNRRHQAEFDRLTLRYDRASSFSSAPGEETKSIMQSLFPGAMKKLPMTLEEIGLGHMTSPVSIAAAEAHIAEPTAGEGAEDEINPPDVDDEPERDPLTADMFEPQPAAR
jgi:hypothetical protein